MSTTSQMVEELKKKQKESVNAPILAVGKPDGLGDNVPLLAQGVGQNEKKFTREQLKAFGVLTKEELDTLMIDSVSEKKIQIIKDRLGSSYDVQNTVDAGLYSTLLGTSIATVFYALINPLAGFISLISIPFVAYTSYRLEKRKKDFYLRSSSFDLADKDQEGPVDEGRPLPESPGLQAPPQRPFVRRSYSRLAINVGLPLTVGAIALAVPPMPVEVWLAMANLGWFVPFVIPLVALIAFGVGLYLQRKKSRIKAVLKLLSDLPDEGKVIKGLEEEQASLIRNLPTSRETPGFYNECTQNLDNLCLMDENLAKYKTRRLITATVSTGVVSACATAAYAYTFFGLALPGSTGFSIFAGVLGISMAVPPLAIAIAIGAALFVAISFGVISYRKWRRSKDKEASKKPGGGVEKAMGFALSAITVVAAAICTMGLALIITGLCMGAYGLVARYKNKENKIKEEKDALIMEISEKQKSSGAPSRSDSADPIPKPDQTKKPPVPKLTRARSNDGFSEEMVVSVRERWSADHPSDRRAKQAEEFSREHERTLEALRRGVPQDDIQLEKIRKKTSDQLLSERMSDFTPKQHPKT